MTAGKTFELRAQGRECVAALALEQLHLLLGAFERGLQRLDELGNRRLALLQRILRDDLVAPERLAREAEKRLAVGPQRFAGDGVKGAAQARLELLQSSEALVLRFRFGFTPHALALERDLQCLFLAARAQRSVQKADGEPGNERNDRDEESQQRAQLRSS
jgi:hypothetical protein